MALVTTLANIPVTGEEREKFFAELLAETAVEQAGGQRGEDEAKK
jgi:hypothetical protein